ncbi:hypothetical protein ACFVQ9_37275 [Streptomyces goshikiensis]|uniref:hypothetical protein n=2 Tax=Streptomyces TaxID=1883 RepID=UPI001AE29DD8|nr:MULTISPECIES: hypothetical protein [Streptomyces]MBP0932049.1 hypothetical protein [Streptomyces sp. KCTC 0041BP]WSR96746.1 hypothetical protein OG224_00835 [Streptomyces goshikiensis]
MPERPCHPVSGIGHSGHQGQGAPRLRGGPPAAAVDLVGAIDRTTYKATININMFTTDPWLTQPRLD